MGRERKDVATITYKDSFSARAAQPLGVGSGGGWSFREKRMGAAPPGPI